MRETRPRFVKQTPEHEYIRDVSPSPTGVRVAVEFRGEIVTVPAEKGDARNLTNCPAANDRSPDLVARRAPHRVRRDAGGEYELWIEGQDGKGEPKKWKLAGAGFYESPAWSPDSKKIVYVDNARAMLDRIDVATGITRKIGADYYYGPYKTLRPAWSPDSRWIAYGLNNAALLQTVSVYSIDQDKSYPVTDGLSDASQPVFDRSGKYLFFASTNAGPGQQLVHPRVGGPPRPQRDLHGRAAQGPALAARQGERRGEGGGCGGQEGRRRGGKEREEGRGARARPTRNPTRSPRRPPVVEPVRIDFDGLSSRILDLPVPEAELSNLQAGEAGQVFVRTSDGKNALQRFDLKDRKTETLLPDVDAYQISADGKKLLSKAKDNWVDRFPLAQRRSRAGRAR